MDVKDVLEIGAANRGVDVEISGWLVDLDDGLFILGDHFPEDYNFPYRLKIRNQNIIYAILQQVPSLGGGRTLLFYKTRVEGILSSTTPPEMFVRRIEVQYNRSSEVFYGIEFDDDAINKFVEKFGEYKFNRAREPMRDWLDEFE